MAYILEGAREHQRLEAQSAQRSYQCSRELEGVRLNSGSVALDAGCGSGAATRYLAGKFPHSKIHGCDGSAERVELARQEAASCPNHGIEFDTQDVTSLKYPHRAFDFILCRYVLEHLKPENTLKALNEFNRCLKPGGRLLVVDMDGLFYNLFPRSEFLDEILTEMERSSPVDLRIGRKLPHYLHSAGFRDIRWRIDTIECHGDTLQAEIELLKAKLEGAKDFLSSFLGSEFKAKRFEKEYISALQQPGVVLFYNKFIVTAKG